MATGPAFDYFQGSDEDKALGLFQLVDGSGEANPEDVSGISRELAVAIYRGMLSIRVVDRRMMALQRQGRIGFYGEALGQEAAVVGAAAAMNPNDWLVPALREAGAGLYRGMSLPRYLSQIFGNAEDISKGRQMPCHPCDPEHNYVVMSSCVSTQIPHAVGIAMGMKAAGDLGRCCFGFMGDGGTSEGDFHTAINFAGVFEAPVVLVCQNNQWAISTPGKAQTASETIAVKGLGYGVESLRADGNDPFAVYTVCKYAADKARRGDGPTFVELLTYRVSAHSSSDDPSRYRDESITEEWKANKDPLKRTLAFLEHRGWLSSADSHAFETELEARVRSVIAEQEGLGSPDPASLFDDVFERLPWHLSEQRQQFLAE
jgi:pyruvate dehydrogenase E1 component alpha subunit/2-oxoisovalerate dehydrogenase E1 component alpha subunit